MNTYTGVHADFSTSEFISKKHAKEAGCIYILNKPESGTSVRAVLDIEGNQLPFIQVGKWKIYNPVVNRRNKSQLRIEDPHGEVSFYHFTSPLTLELIINTMRELSSFNSWKEYKLQIKINELEAEIKSLKT